MTVKEAEEYAKNMTYREAVYNALQGRAVPFKKASKIKLNELLEIADKADLGITTNEVLDKIRTDIKAMFPPSGDWMYDEGYEHEHTVCEVLVDVLQIIDKYRVEGNGEK